MDDIRTAARKNIAEGTTLDEPDLMTYGACRLCGSANRSYVFRDGDYFEMGMCCSNPSCQWGN